jgi:hypothetical protein
MHVFTSEWCSTKYECKPTRQFYSLTVWTPHITRWYPAPNTVQILQELYYFMMSKVFYIILPLYFVPWFLFIYNSEDPHQVRFIPPIQPPVGVFMTQNAQ